MVDAAFQPRPKFIVHFGLEGWAAANLTAGFSPATHLGDAIAQVSLLPLLRWIAIFVQEDFFGIIRSFSGVAGKDRIIPKKSI